jgi:integrase
MARAENLPKGISRRADGKLLAQVWSKRDQRRISRVFERRDLAAAKAWRRDTQTALARGAVVAGESPTLRRASEMFLQGAEEGTIRTRSRRPYKPATIKRYRRAFDQHLLDALGSYRLNEIRASQLEHLVGKLQAKGLAANSVRNAFMPLQAMYRWAVRLDYAAVDPTHGVELPLDDGRRDRFATPEEVQRLIDALPERDRPLWATAFYAGLRRGELMALRWSDVDLATGVIRVQLSHDPESGTTGAPKSAAGERRAPIPPALREHLIEHRMRANPKQPLVFARSSLAGRYRKKDGPFEDGSVSQRARRFWGARGFQSITLHECRHTFASLMIAAMAADGKFNPLALQRIMGHSSITTTYDRYGHLMPGAEEESANQLQAFLDGAGVGRSIASDEVVAVVEQAELR